MSADPQRYADFDLRRVGTRLLYRLSQCAAGLRPGLLERGQLGFCHCQPEVGENKKTSSFFRKELVLLQSRVDYSRSTKPSRLRERAVVRSLRSALASIWRIRSRVTANCLPTSSSV